MELFEICSNKTSRRKTLLGCPTNTNLQKMMSPSSSSSPRLQTHCNIMPKSSEDLKKEIASLEFEILRAEQYLLSLYRKAFDEQVASFSPSTQTSLVSNRFCPESETGVFSYHYEASPVSQRSSSCPRSFQASLKALSAREKVRCVSGGHTTLGDLLGSSRIIDNILNPSRLSEEILRCISSVYRTLSNRARTNSSPSFVSSKTTFDRWNPCHGVSKDANVQLCVVIESLKVHLDDGSFNYTALMLQNFRSLVAKLEKVDPNRIKREEKLAFWINIHNALTMHAHLAYGTHNRARNTSVLKATYDVGGYRVNPHIIQTAILGIHPHFSPPTLFSPSRKSKTCNDKHVYALDYPEALAHFALSSGASSDPPVRVYTADSVFRDLRRAKEEFIRNNVRIQNDTKILLPKIVHYYAKDMSMDATGIIETTVKSLPDSTKRKLLKKKSKKNIEFLGDNSSFRYVIIIDDSSTNL